MRVVSDLRVVSHQGGLSSGWSLIRVVSHIRVVCHQGCLTSEWPLIREQGGLSSGCKIVYGILGFILQELVKFVTPPHRIYWDRLSKCTMYRF